MEGQISVFLLCMLVGIAAGIPFDGFYLLKRCIPRLGIACDLLSFLCLSALYVCFSVRFHFPDFRLYLYLGVLAGLLLYRKSFHRMVAFLYETVYNKRSERKRGKKHDGRESGTAD